MGTEVRLEAQSAVAGCVDKTRGRTRYVRAPCLWAARTMPDLDMGTAELR